MEVVLKVSVVLTWPGTRISVDVAVSVKPQEELLC